MLKTMMPSSSRALISNAHMVNGHISYADFYQLFQNEMTYKYYFNLMSDMAPDWPFHRADFLSALRGSDRIFQPRLTPTENPRQSTN